MKKILSLVALVLFVAVYAQANAALPGSPVGMSVIKSGDVVKLFYRGEKIGKVRVTIYNERGRTVFAETMRNKEHFMRPYNFSSLPEGDYTIEIADEHGVRSGKVTHSFRSSGNNEWFAHVTRLNHPDSRYLLAVANPPSDEITVRIYDERNNLLYEETENVDGEFAKLYNLDKVTSNPTFEIRDSEGNVSSISKPLRK